MYNNNTGYKELTVALLFLIGYPMIIGYIWMKAWSWIIVPIFSYRTLSYLQSVVLYYMSSVGFGYLYGQFYPTKQQEKVYWTKQLFTNFNYNLFIELSVSYLFPHVYLLVAAYIVNIFFAL